MRTGCFIFILFFLSIKGFAQELNVTLYPDNKDVVTKIGEFPVVLNWDNKANLIKIQLKGNGRKDKFIYFFREIRLFKEIQEQDDEIWFSKKIQKEADRNLVKKFLDNKLQVNSVYKKGPEVMKRGAEIEYASLGANTIGEFLFAVKNPEKDFSKITITAYIASEKENPKLFSSRERVMEYIENFTFNVTLVSSFCGMPEMKAAVDSIREKTKELDNIEIEIVKFLTNCNRVSRLKDEAKQYKVELPVSSKYAGCEEWEQAIKKNNKIYEAIQLEQCKEEVVVAVKKPEPPVPCDLISKKLDAANNQLRLLLLQIRTKKGDTATILEEYESIKASVNSVYVPAFNTKCATKKDKDVYKAYKGWCANIDEELLK